jgi:hypothetical protein
MKAASINEIKKELQLLDEKALIELCLNVARYKKENKEYLGYLLFESSNRDQFIVQVKDEIVAHFNELQLQANLYYVKKGLRKVLRIINRYCKYIDEKSITADLLIYFCSLLNSSGIQWKKNKMIVNIYHQQLKKINVLIASLHEDLQQDYQRDLEKLVNEK